MAGAGDCFGGGRGSVRYCLCGLSRAEAGQMTGLRKSRCLGLLDREIGLRRRSAMEQVGLRFAQTGFETEYWWLLALEPAVVLP